MMMVMTVDMAQIEHYLRGDDDGDDDDGDGDGDDDGSFKRNLNTFPENSMSPIESSICSVAECCHSKTRVRRGCMLVPTRDSSIRSKGRTTNFH